ncbi:MAG: phosphoribosylformylglycinamidine synthase subunit PurQ, partial [Victivallales bacterium]|nr:phosphoribosylformylglycinamidine synthase subunit PurQ [Victivallales bacterium]
PKKYDGLDGTELAISESQERMACVFAPEHVAKAMELAKQENLEATQVAVVTEAPVLRMTWRGKTIISIRRDFLDTNGVTQHANAFVEAPDPDDDFFKRQPECMKGSNSLKDAWLANLRDLNVCSQKGLVERFDGSVGAATVLSPYGGKYRLTPNEAMSAKIPLDGHTNTCTLMSHGYNPYLSEWSPFHGALYAVIEANAKIAAAGGDVNTVRMSFQEYFERLNDVPERWGKPLAALLGGLQAQLEFGTAAIGGKDSMSGTFEDIHVPPTLVAFAVTTANAGDVISDEFKNAGAKVYLLPVTRDAEDMPDFAKLRKNFEKLHNWLVVSKTAVTAHTVGQGGIAAAVSQMCFGNMLGFTFADGWNSDNVFTPDYGSILFEAKPGCSGFEGAVEVGTITDGGKIVINGEAICLCEAVKAWQEPLEPIFLTSAKASAEAKPVWQPWTKGGRHHTNGASTAQPRVFIPIFPGTNCEYDTAKAFRDAGAVVTPVVFRNLNAQAIEDSVNEFVAAIRNAQIIAFPGGFSSGDEPDGSGKFIATTFRNPRIADAVNDLLKNRDGLAIGICNGFQALVKLGLVTYGEIIPRLAEDDPTLTFNTIGRHSATVANTVVASNLSPWLANCQPGQVHAIPISHGEGRFVATAEMVKELFATGRVAFQYADENGKPAESMPWNPNGSVCAIEGITSPDGRVLGKMGHSERVVDTFININVPGNREQRLFQAGVEYFK